MAAEKTTSGASRSDTSKKSTGKRAGGAKKTGGGKKTSSGATDRARAPRAEPRPRKRAAAIAQDAAEQLSELLGKSIEGVTAIQHTDDGWKVELEVLELRRVPNTTDVLATYAVTMADNGDLAGYRREHRYARGSTAGDGT